MTREKLKGHILIFITNILFALNVPISKYLLPDHLDPLSLTIMRMAFACIMFWIVSFFVHKESVPLKDLGMLFVCAMCGVGFNQALFLLGLNRTSPVDASIIATFSPVFVMLLAAMILKEPITKLKAGGVLVGAAGAILLIASSANPSSNVSGVDGDLMIVLSGLTYSFYLVLSKPLTMKYSSVTIMKWMFLFSTLTFLPFSLQSVVHSPALNRTTIDLLEWSAIAFVLIGATFLPYLLIPMSLKRIRPTTISMYNNVQPIVASFIAVMYGQDKFSISNVISTLLVCVGVYMVTRSKSRADMLSVSNTEIKQ